MAKSLIPVILSGGSGTRLWPLSRPERPKQLLPLVSERTMLQETIMRLSSLGEDVGDPIVICNAAHADQVATQLEDIDVTPRAIVLEPAGRNTAPAIAVAAMLVAGDAEGDADANLLVLPADHVIEDAARFCRAVEIALEAAAAGKLVTFGVVPARPETGYGYIRASSADGAWGAIAEFVEKPDIVTAERYLQSGDYFWNSGMFLFSAQAYLAAVAEHAPEMVDPCRASLIGAREEGGCLHLGQQFLDSPADSIDYAVMEKTQEAAVVPLDAGWSDVGSWPALHEILEADPLGNVFRGEVAAEDCRDCYVLANSRRVAVLGLNGVVVVETDDTVLVVPLERAQDLKQLVGRVTRDRR